MHINTVKIEDYWIKFDIENVKAKDKNGKCDESVQAVATFVKNGEDIHKIHNIGNFDYCAKLLDNDYAKSEAARMINEANKSVHSPFKVQ